MIKGKAVFLLAASVLLAAGCGIKNGEGSGNEGKSPDIRSEEDLSTDTRSTHFLNREEKLAFLEKYMNMPSEPVDAEYHIVYHDNSKGLVPGPSDWDIRVAMKVREADIPLWTDGMKEIPPQQIDLGWWEDLKTEAISWGQEEIAEYYKRPDAQTYVVVYHGSGIVMKRISTMAGLKGL